MNDIIAESPENFNADEMAKYPQKHANLHRFSTNMHNLVASKTTGTKVAKLFSNIVQNNDLLLSPTGSDQEETESVDLDYQEQYKAH